MIDLNDRFSRLIIVYLLWLASSIFSASLFEVYFYNLGLSPQEIFLADSLWFAAGIMILPFLKTFRSRRFMLAGIAVAILSVLLLYLYPIPFAAFPFRLLAGIPNILFWLPFNILFYEFRKGDHAALGALYYSLSPMLSLFAPGLAGIIATSAGFPALYLFTMAILGLAFILTMRFVEDKEYSVDFRQCVKSISGLRTLIFMEGFAAAVIVQATLEVMLLLFIDKPAEYGGFISLVTVFAILSTFITAKLSDKIKKRRHFLLPVALLFGLSAVLASQAPDISAFFIGFGLVVFFSRIFFPLPLALVVDNTKSLPESMAGREFFLNLGRFSGAILGFAVFLYSDIRTVLLLQGLVLLIYVPIFENRKQKLVFH